MTPEEQQLLAALSNRIKSAPAHDKDAEADQVLQQLVQERPDTTYLLAQTVIMQDFALRSAQAQITQLQKQIQQAPQPQRSGSFLSGLFGSGQAPASSSVPPVNPWGRPAQPQPAYAPPPQGYAPPPQPAYAYQPVTMQPSQTSGFLRSAATTAAGVAGGALLFEGIQSLFSGHMGYGGFGGGMGGGWGGGGFGPSESLSETTIVNNNYYDEPAGGGGNTGAQTSDYQNDPGQFDQSDSYYQDASDTGSDYSDSGGGGDFGGSDDTSV